ncbi:hypothetical protein V6Z11_A05G164700 [Gossypium hirsutum]
MTEVGILFRKINRPLFIEYINFHFVLPLTKEWPLFSINSNQSDFFEDFRALGHRSFFMKRRGLTRLMVLVNLVTLMRLTSAVFLRCDAVLISTHLG